MFHGSEYIKVSSTDDWVRHLFKHLKCIFKLNKVENIINMLAYSWSNGWTELAEIC